MHMPIDPFYAGKSGTQGQFIRIRWINDKTRLLVGMGQRIGNERSELRRMPNAVGSCSRVLQQQCICYVGTAFDTEQPAASADKGIGSG